MRALLENAFDALKKEPTIGIKIPRGLWPKEYKTKFEIENLYKYDLSDGWRLIYFIRGSELAILAIILEWMPHKKYEERFKYKVK